MKKILAVVLAIVMVFSMGAIAYAEDDTTTTTAAAEEEAPAVNFNIADTINNIINQIVAALQDVFTHRETPDLARVREIQLQAQRAVLLPGCRQQGY